VVVKDETLNIHLMSAVWCLTIIQTKKVAFYNLTELRDQWKDPQIRSSNDSVHVKKKV